MPLAAFPKCFVEDMTMEERMSVADWIAISDKFDIDGLEFYSGFAPFESIEKWKAFACEAANHNRAIPMLCHSSDFTNPDPTYRKEQVKLQKAAIDTAVALNAKYFRILTGQRRPEVSVKQGVEWVKECILESIEYAEKRGIILNIENHYKDHTWFYPEFAQKREIFLEVLAAIPETKWFGVNYDPSNAVIAGEDPIVLLQAVKHRVVTMHASDRYFEKGKTVEDLKQLELQPLVGYASILKHGVIGQGLNDYDQIFSILHEVGFNGWISIEDGPEGPSKAQDDRVATCGEWWNASSLSFRHCDDPLRLGDADRASPWPSVGDILVGRLHVPVLFVCTGAGGTTAEQWRKGAEDAALKTRGYPACRLVLQELTPYTGLRAVVWFGNENDLGRGPTAEAFSDDLRKVIARSRVDSGYPDSPWVIAFDAYDPGVTDKFGAGEKQRRKECLDRGTEIVLQTVPYTYDGPQTDDLGPDFRRADRDHFNEAGIRQLGLRFARKIEQAFFPPPLPSPQLPRECGVR
jgi:sugar phosphate isomerase/epimerase